MAEQTEFVQFTHETKFDVAKFDDYPFDKHYEGPIFTTCHGGVGYLWRIYICPNGGKSRYKLDSGEWSESKEDRKKVLCYLNLVGGPSSAVTAGYSLKVKLTSKTAPVLYQIGSPVLYQIGSLNKYYLFDKDNCWGSCIGTKEQLEKNGIFNSGFLTVIAEINIKSERFNSDYILRKRKAEITEDKEKITPVSSAFFDMIDEEPACGVSLKLVVGNARKNFFCIHQVLEQNSAYFRNLLCSNPEFKENKESKVEFFDLNPEGVRAALRYIYLKELSENFEQVADECLPAAHLFLLPGLVLECERVLIGNMRAENDVAMAFLANTFGLNLLKDMALNSIIMHFDDILKDADMTEKLKKDELFDELLILISFHMRSQNGTVV